MGNGKEAEAVDHPPKKPFFHWSLIMSHKMFCTKQRKIGVFKQRKSFYSLACLGLGVLSKMRGLQTKWPRQPTQNFPFSQRICAHKMNKRGLTTKSDSTE